MRHFSLFLNLLKIYIDSFSLGHETPEWGEIWWVKELISFLTPHSNPFHTSNILECIFLEYYIYYCWHDNAFYLQVIQIGCWTSQIWVHLSHIAGHDMQKHLLSEWFKGFLTSLFCLLQCFLINLNLYLSFLSTISCYEQLYSA